VFLGHSRAGSPTDLTPCLYFSDFDLVYEFGRVRSESYGRFAGKDDKWGYTHGSSIKITGRHVLSIWRIIRSELPLTQYTFENVVYHVLRTRWVMTQSCEDDVEISTHLSLFTFHSQSKHSSLFLFHFGKMVEGWNYRTPEKGSNVPYCPSRARHQSGGRNRDDIPQCVSFPSLESNGHVTRGSHHSRFPCSTYLQSPDIQWLFWNKCTMNGLH
jgi:hypothetical protein